VLDEAAAPKADVGWANSQAKAAKKAAQSRWGAGWNLLSVEQQKGAVALVRSAGGVEESEPHPDSPAGITAHFRREREMKLKVARAKKERAKAEREWNKKRKAGR